MWRGSQLRTFFSVCSLKKPLIGRCISSVDLTNFPTSPRPKLKKSSSSCGKRLFPTEKNRRDSLERQVNSLILLFKLVRGNDFQRRRCNEKRTNSCEFKSTPSNSKWCQQLTEWVAGHNQHDWKKKATNKHNGYCGLKRSWLKRRLRQAEGLFLIGRVKSFNFLFVSFHCPPKSQRHFFGVSLSFCGTFL